MSRIKKTRLPFYWQPIIASFQDGTASQVDLSSYVTNPQTFRVLTYSALTVLPTGMTLLGSLLKFSGTGTPGTVQCQFRITDGTYTAESDVTGVTTVAQAGTNTAPTWNTPADRGIVTGGSPFSFTLTATDAQSDPINFAYNNPALGAVTQQTQSVANRSVIWSGTAPTNTGTTPITYTFTIDATDSPPLGQVTGLTVGATTSSSVALSWTVVSGATLYTVERSASSSGPWNGAGTSVSGSLTVTGLSPVTQYFFRVTASSATQTSVPSAVQTATTAAIVVTDDWTVRSTGTDVVWAHRFDTESEVLAFLKIAQNAPDTYASLGTNSACTLAHDPIVRGAQWVTDIKASGVGSLKLTNIGSLLSANTVGFPTVAAGGTSSISIVDASEFPDPSPSKTGTQALADMVATSTYPPAAYCIDINDYGATDAESGSKGKRERVAVIKVDKATNTLYCRRGLVFAEMVTGGGQNPKTFDVPARTAVGGDCDGGWCRPFAAFVAGDNGKTTDDKAASGAVPLRSTWNPANPSASISGWSQSSYAHPAYQLLDWAALNGMSTDFDGSEFWLQFKFRLGGNRYAIENDWTRFGLDPDLGAGKLFFVATSGSVDLQEIVATTGAARQQFTCYTNKGQAPGIFDQYIAGVDYIEPGGPYQVATCTSASRGGCWTYPTNEWFTFMIHVIPGHHFEHRVPHNSTAVEAVTSLTVDSGGTNDGTTISFTCDAPPDYKYGVVSRSTANYFKGYQVANTAGTAGLATSGTSGNVSIQSSSVSGGKLTLNCIRRASAALPTGTPTAGQQITLIPFNTATNTVAPDTTLHVPTFLEVKVKRDSDPTWVTLNNSSVGHFMVFGNGQGNPANHPFGWNAFQPTGYQNVQDNAVPPAKTYSYWFDEVIFSRAAIPAPA